ncbi:MAG: SLC13 family permease [Planctomycetota bacterium]
MTILGAGTPLHQSPPWIMALFGLVMAATYVVIATERVHKTVAASFGALSLVALGLALDVFPLGYEQVYEILSHDLGVLGVIIGTSILVEVTGASGLFHFIAIRIVKATGGDPVRLFGALMILTFVFVSLLTIVPAMLVVTSLVLVVTRTLGLDPKPFVIGTALAANTGACTTLASSLPNLMIGGKAGLGYGDFVLVSAPMGLIGLLVTWWWVGRRYRDTLRHPAVGPQGETAAELVSRFDEWALVKDLRIFRRSALILGATVLGFLLARPLGVGIDYVAIVGGVLALFLSGMDAEEAIRKVNWTVVLFFVGLFTIVGAVKATGLLAVAAGALEALTGGSPGMGIALFTSASALLSGLVDNIPVAATLIPVIQDVTALPHGPLWWALVLGANFGGNLTPIGSIASVIALHAFERETGQKVSWGEFLKVGGFLTLLLVLLSVGYLLAYDALIRLPGGG